MSIVIDNYNYARFLPQCIESALAQTYPSTEVVVVDDASTDGSQEIIRKFDRVVPVLRERNGGQGAAFNAGFAACSGDIVFFLDSDDLLAPDAVAAVVAAWEPGAAKAQYRLEMIGADGAAIDVHPPRYIRFDSGDVVPLLLRRGRYQTAVTSGNAFAREALQKILPVPEGEYRISADGYLVTVAPLYGRVVSIDRPLGTYRVHGSNLWNLWATPGAVNAQPFRGRLDHDLVRYAALGKACAALGLRPREDPGLRDWMHLENRLCSLCLEPEQHPIKGDRRWSLALRGAWEALADARLIARWRTLLALWFLAVGLLPRGLARASVNWRMRPTARPRALAGMLRLMGLQRWRWRRISEEEKGTRP